MARHVLVIDDSEIIRSVMCSALQEAGFAVDVAEDGLAALELLDGRPIDSIVCDVSMPRLDGLGFLQALRANARYGRVPVLMLTTDSRAGTRGAARETGAQAYLNKPCKPGVFVDAVNRLCA
jgi:two-component system, chemotaxis family, chemotaxis protein CheY